MISDTQIYNNLRDIFSSLLKVQGVFEPDPVYPTLPNYPLRWGSRLGIVEANQKFTYAWLSGSPAPVADTFCNALHTYVVGLGITESIPLGQEERFEGARKRMYSQMGRYNKVFCPAWGQFKFDSELSLNGTTYPSWMFKDLGITDIAINGTNQPREIDRRDCKALAYEMLVSVSMYFPTR
ncbi:MAG: hypothetical protein HRU12_23695 [Phaeodactylibacter sp.]|nr:hypothetical protein [Phaeodactylibacter sp.]